RAFPATVELGLRADGEYAGNKNALGPQLSVHGPGDVRLGGLRRAVRAEARDRELADGTRTDQHMARAGFEHVRQGGADRVERAEEVGLEDVADRIGVRRGQEAFVQGFLEAVSSVG